MTQVASTSMEGICTSVLASIYAIDEHMPPRISACMRLVSTLNTTTHTPPKTAGRTTIQKIWLAR